MWMLVITMEMRNWVDERHIVHVYKAFYTWATLDFTSVNQSQLVQDQIATRQYL